MPLIPGGCVGEEFLLHRGKWAEGRRIEIQEQGKIVRSPIITSLPLATARPVLSQQRADTTFQPVVDKPAYDPGGGPVVLVDAAHNNFDSLGGSSSRLAGYWSEMDTWFALPMFPSAKHR